MQNLSVKHLLFILFAVWSLVSFAQKPTEKSHSSENEFLTSTQANWMFSGIVTNESDEAFGYFFQIQRKDDLFHATATIIDAQTKQILLEEDIVERLQEVDPFRFKVGNVFLTFNPITESWIFGVQSKDKVGFNFKVDMLNPQFSQNKAQKLRNGIMFKVNQTGRLNGHIQFKKNEKEHFVTAANTWFRQLWLTRSQLSYHPVSSLLCRFEDGSGLYSINMKEEDAEQGAVSGFCDSKGINSNLSQFIEINEALDKVWHVHIPFPDMKFRISQSAHSEQTLAGFVLDGAKQGFCVLLKNKLGDEKVV